MVNFSYFDKFKTGSGDGATASGTAPSSPTQFFNTETNRPVWWNGTKWIDHEGNIATLVPGNTGTTTGTTGTTGTGAIPAWFTGFGTNDGIQVVIGTQWNAITGLTEDEVVELYFVEGQGDHFVRFTETGTWGVEDPNNTGNRLRIQFACYPLLLSGGKTSAPTSQMTLGSVMLSAYGTETIGNTAVWRTGFYLYKTGMSSYGFKQMFSNSGNYNGFAYGDVFTTEGTMGSAVTYNGGIFKSMEAITSTPEA